LRQAYDYWQNQPGNYLSAAGFRRWLPAIKTAEQFTETARSRNRSGPGARLRRD